MSGQAAEIRMGNDIARQFAHLAPERAAEQIATHVEKFWEQRMQDNLHRLLRDGAGRATEEAHPLLVAAEQKLRRDQVDEHELEKPSGG